MTTPYPQQGYPQQPPPQQYPPPGYPMPQQQYAPQVPQQPQQPQQPRIPGSLDTFFDQPSVGGGPSLKFPDGQYGTAYVGVVARAITNGDVDAQTDKNGNVQRWNDGRPKEVMRVPLNVQPSPQYPEGKAQWYVKGQARDELIRAMAEAGAPTGPPEAGATITVTYTADRPVQGGFNPAKQFQVQYQRPQGANNSAPAQQVAPAQPQPSAQPQPQQQQQQPQYQHPQQAPQQGPPPPAGMTPEQAQILANVANQPQPQQG